MQRSSLGLQLGLHDLLRVIPRPTGVRHEDGLVQPEQRDGNQVADEEERLHKGKRKRRKEHRQEDVEHPLLRVLRADLDHFLRIRHRRLGHAFQLDVSFDELDSAIGARGHRLHRRAGEPVNHRAAGDQAEQERRVQNREVRKVFGQALRQQHDDRKDHGGGPDDGGADQNRLSRGLEGIASAIIFFEILLGNLELGMEAKVLLNFLLDVRNCLDHRQFVDRLRIVRHGAVGVDGNRHRAHSQKAEGYQSEGEHGRGLRNNDVVEAKGGHEISD